MSYKSNRFLSNTPQEFTDEEVELMWEKLRLRDFMALYNNDPVKTCEIVNLRYNDLQPDTLTWDVNPLSAVTAVKKYRLRFTKVGSSDITEQESLTTTYILNNIDDGMWTVQVTPVGEYSIGTPASVSFTIRTLQDKVDIFTVDAKLHSGSTRADAKYDITAEDEHNPQIYASLSEVPDNIGYGFKIVKPDETEELRDNVNSISNYVLDADVGTYTFYAYLKDSFGNHYSTTPKTLEYIFQNTMSLISLNKDSYYSNESVVITKLDKKAADYIDSYKLYKNNTLIATLPKTTTSISLADYATTLETADFELAPVDKLGNEAKHSSFTAALLPIFAASFTAVNSDHYDSNMYDTVTITKTAQNSAIDHYIVDYVLESESTQYSFSRTVQCAGSDVCTLEGDVNDRFGLYTLTITAYDSNNNACPTTRTVQEYHIGDFICGVTVSVDTDSDPNDIIVTATNYSFIREFRYTMDSEPQSEPVTGNNGIYRIAKASTPDYHTIRTWCYGKADTTNPPSPKTAGPFTYYVKYPIETAKPFIEPSYNENNDLWCYMVNSDINNSVNHYTYTVDGGAATTITPTMVSGSLKGVIDTSSWTPGTHDIVVTAYDNNGKASLVSDTYPFYVKYPIEDVTPTTTFNESNMTLTFTVPSGITVDHYVYSAGPIQHQNSNGTVDVSSWAEDEYSVTVNAVDSLGNESLTGYYTLVMPAIRKLTPVITDSNNIVTWSIAASANATSYTYSIDSGTPVTTSSTTFDGNILASGQHSITVTAYNQYGTASLPGNNTFTVSFAIENETPTITYNKANHQIVLTIDNVTPDHYEYTSAEKRTGTTTTGIIDTSGWAERVITFTATAYDSAGHHSLTATRDIELYDITDITPTVTRNENTVSWTIPAGITADSYEYRIDSGSAQTTANTSIDITGISGGSHTVSVVAYDTVNNKHSLEGTCTFTVTYTINDVTVTLSESPYKFETGVSVDESGITEISTLKEEVTPNTGDTGKSLNVKANGTSEALALVDKYKIEYTNHPAGETVNYFEDEAVAEVNSVSGKILNCYASNDFEYIPQNYTVTITPMDANGNLGRSFTATMQSTCKFGIYVPKANFYTADSDAGSENIIYLTLSSGDDAVIVPTKATYKIDNNPEQVETDSSGIGRTLSIYKTTDGTSTGTPLTDGIHTVTVSYELDKEEYHWESPEIVLTFRTGNFGIDDIYLTAAPGYENPHFASVSIDRENTYPLVPTNYNVIDSCKYTYTLPGASTESTAYTSIDEGGATIGPIQYAGPETQIQVTIWPALENTQSIGQHSVTVTVTTMNNDE